MSHWYIAANFVRAADNLFFVFEALSDAGNMRAFVENIKSLTNDSDNKIKALEKNIKNLITNDDKKIRALEDNIKNLTTEADKIRILEENITILQRKLVRKIQI